jgi:hypothetical protein
MKSLNEYLRGKGPGGHGSYNYRLRAKLRRLSEDLRRGAPKSPTSWAVSLSTCAFALRFLADSWDSHALAARQSFLEVTPKVLAGMMAATRDNMMRGARDYRARGIDPQAHITILPHIERAKAAVQLWQERAPLIRASAEQNAECVAVGG